jgi:hypothetical protein
MWWRSSLFYLLYLVAVHGEEVSVNEFGESVPLSQINKTGFAPTKSHSFGELDDLSSSTSTENAVELFAEKTYPNIIRVTRSNYGEILKQQPFSVLLIHDERNDNDPQQGHLMENVISAANDRGQSSEVIKVQFLHLDARSSSCEELIRGVWKVRRSYYEEETVYPSCYQEGNFTPQLWLFHWKDLSMMSPLRFTSPLSNGEVVEMPLDVVSAKMIGDTLSNLIAMDMAYVS